MPYRTALLEQAWPTPHRRTYAEEVVRGEEFGIHAAGMLILKALSHGLLEAEIPDITGFSIDEVKHQAHLFREELKAKNNAHAVAIAMRLGLID